MSALPANVRTLMPSRAEVGPAEEATQLHPAMNEASSAPEPPLYVRTRAPEWLPRLLAPVIGLALFVAFWAILAKAGGGLPDPVSTWHSAVDVFSNPFYKKGPNDQGIGWNVLTSLGRVGIGFWVWDEWNNLKVEHIIIAIFTIGIVGLLLEQALMLVARRFSYS